MSMWRCPHCGTPQAETARCWVCHRSSTTCSTCRHFRRSVAVQIGYCGLDRRRLPLLGTEHRGCWEGGSVYEATLTGEGRPAAISSPTPAAHRDDGHHREFVPVELTREHAPEREPGQQARIGPTPGTTFSVAPEPARPDASIQPVTLFHDLDR